MKAIRIGLLATVSSIALVGSAVAQPPAPVMSWAGAYGGVNVGALWNRASYTDVDQFFFILGGPPNNNFWSNSSAQFTIGGLLGYNWQTRNIVYGFEGDLNWASGSVSASIPGATAGTTASSNLKSIATLRARLGVAYESMLFYVTGGVAFARFSDNWGLPGFEFPAQFSRTGWTGGGGVERMFAPHWVGRVEVLYSDFGTQTATAPGAGFTYRTEFQHSVTQARAALIYKW